MVGLYSLGLLALHTYTGPSPIEECTVTADYNRTFERDVPCLRFVAVV